MALKHSNAHAHNDMHGKYAQPNQTAACRRPKSGISKRGQKLSEIQNLETEPVTHNRSHKRSAMNKRPLSGLYNRGESRVHEALGLSKLGMEALTRKERLSVNVRPLSAPVKRGKRKKRNELKSAKGRYVASADDSQKENNEEEDMFSVVKLAKEAKQFEEDTAFFRELEKSLQEPQHDDDGSDTPVFNKRLFASQGNVIITEEARRLMLHNAISNKTGDVDTSLRKSELHCLRCIVDGLKLIHKGQDFVKDVLSRVVTYEVYDAFTSIPEKSWEDSLSCYFILNGAVEVTYDMRARESRNVYQANIVYSHGTGEYVGLVSPEGPSEDLAPPATIYCKELTQFIRVDRARFHKIMDLTKEVIDKRKRDYISKFSFLAKVPVDVQEKILHKLYIQEFPANRVLLAQGEKTEYLFIIMKGRCQTYREVFIPEAGRDMLFYLTSRDKDDFFGEECLLDQSPSYCTVVTATSITCLTLHKSALQIVNKERLSNFIEAERHEFLSQEELGDLGYKDSVWNKYKHEQIKYSLKEGGKLKFLNKVKTAPVMERPPKDDERYHENMQRFVMQGSKFEPVRVQSATVRKARHMVHPRPHTAFVKRQSKPDLQERDLNSRRHIDASEAPIMQDEDKTSTLLTASKARELEKKVTKVGDLFVYPDWRYREYKAMDSKEAMLKLLESGELASHFPHAANLDELRDKETFMKTGVLVTMKSADIVRKAKALADTYADNWKERTEEENEEWNTILHAENKQAKFLITANRMRLRDIKRKLLAIQRKREKLGLKKYEPDNEATNDGASFKKKTT